MTRLLFSELFREAGVGGLSLTFPIWSRVDDFQHVYGKASLWRLDYLLHHGECVECSWKTMKPMTQMLRNLRNCMGMWLTTGCRYPVAAPRRHHPEWDGRAALPQPKHKGVASANLACFLLEA